MEKNNEKKENLKGIELDEQEFSLEEQEVSNGTPVVPQQRARVNVVAPTRRTLKSCLRNERIIVQHLPKQSGLVHDKRHVLYGGMAENATRTYVVPLLRSGGFVDVLTKDEKEFLEAELGLEANALSVHNRVNNFWSDANDLGISRVTLNKQDNYLDLSNPVDYIKYKILLANKDFIAPSLEALQDHYKVTYEFVIISESSKNKLAKLNMSSKMASYKEFGKIENDAYTLRVIIEQMEGRPTANNTPLETLQVKVNDLIQTNATMFLKVITDEYLPMKVLIKKAVEAGIISKRGTQYYLRRDNTPLCGLDQEATLNIAAAYLKEPKNQELRFEIEAKLNND